MQTTSPPPRQDDWSPCQSGDISGLVRSLRLNRSRSVRRRRIAAAACVGLLAVAGTWIGAPAWRGAAELVADVTCVEVRANAAGYIAGSIPADLKLRIDQHLAHCPHCRDVVDQRRQHAAETGTAGAGETLGDAAERRPQGLIGQLAGSPR